LRAEAVYNYFISKELSGDKFEIAGSCEDFPIAGNYTQASRRASRKIVLIRIQKWHNDESFYTENAKLSCQ